MGQEVEARADQVGSPGQEAENRRFGQGAYSKKQKAEKKLRGRRSAWHSKDAKLICGTPAETVGPHYLGTSKMVLGFVNWVSYFSTLIPKGIDANDLIACAVSLTLSMM